MQELVYRSLSEHQHSLNLREYSALELTRAFFERIVEFEHKINAYVSVCPEQALKEAAESDERRRRGELRSSLDGIPYAAKDNIAVKGMPLCCGSRILQGYISPFDATVIKTLRERGCILLGKTNLDEFAMGTDTETSAHGRTRNPINIHRVTGGSSGGSAAAVAAREAVFALGSDTGGSVRQPAAFCGIFGLRPTYSAISRYGLVGFAPSIDTVGILTHTARDCAEVMNAAVGKDSLDATSRPHPSSDLCSLIGKDIKGIKVGLVSDALGDGLSGDVRYAIDRASELLRQLGASVEEVSIPHFDSSYAVYYTYTAAEAASSLSRFDGVRYGYRAEGCRTPDELFAKSRGEGFGREVKKRILFGNLALSEGNREQIYSRAVAMRKRMLLDLSEILSRYDILLLPTASDHAYRAGAKKSALYGRDDLLCAPASLAGLPALSVPCDIDGGMPVGIQLMGRAFGEELIFSVAHLLEKALNGGAR